MSNQNNTNNQKSQKRPNQPQIDLQNAFLNEVRKTRMQITVFLVNGFQMKGVVKNFDNFTILLVKDGKEHLIYKHSITTLVPHKILDLEI